MDDSHREPLAVLEGDAHRPGGKSVEEVDRPVERIDDPAPPALALAARALFGEQAVARTLGREQLADGPLGLAVGVGDQVGLRGLRAEALGLEPVKAEQQLAGLARRAEGQLEIRLQRIARSPNTTTSTRATTTRTQIRKRKASCSERSGFSTR
jgi:hypothetical protein